MIANGHSNGIAEQTAASQEQKQNKIARGALIVLEGCDRTGKSTQAVKLVEALSKAGTKCKLQRFPDRSLLTGELIEKYLQKKNELCCEAVHLLFSANRWEVKKKMLEWLDEGYTLVLDRYAYSGVVYTHNKPDNQRSLDWLKSPDAGLLKPDLVILMSLDPEEQKKRIGFGGERYENLALQTKISKEFLQMKDHGWSLIDASRDMEEIHADLLQKAVETIKSVAENGAPLQELW